MFAVKNKASLTITALLAAVDILWWLTDIKNESSIDTDDSMVVWAFSSIVIVFAAMAYVLVRLILSIIRKEYRWLYTFLPIISSLLVLFLIRWVPET